MASLTSQSISQSYEQLLHVDTDGGGNTTNLVPVKDGDNGTTFALQLSTTTVCIDNPTASANDQGGILRLQSDDGAVMASGHRLGVIEFGGAEDTSSTITVGARIEAITDATWSPSENGADMVFYTTDGDAIQSPVLRLTAAGNVGIGTSDPNKSSYGSNAKVLTVADYGSVGDYGAVEIAGRREDDGVYAQLEFTHLDSSGDKLSRAFIRGFRDGANDASGLKFSTEATGASDVIAMTITSAGKVGVGTTVPSHDFSVGSNDGGVISLLREDADNDISTSAALGKLYFGGDDPTNNTFQIGASIESIAAAEWGTGGSSTDCPANILFKTCANGANTLNEVMRVAHSGYVGIGGVDPEHKLHIYSDDDDAQSVLLLDHAGADSGYGTYLYARADKDGTTTTTGSAALGAVYYNQASAGGVDRPVGFLYFSDPDGHSHYYWVDTGNELCTSGTGGDRGKGQGESGVTVVGDQTSDERLKNISTDAFPYGLGEINKLKPIKYSLKSDSKNVNKLGFGAQTTESILPEVVKNTGACVDGYTPKWEKGKERELPSEEVANSDDRSKRTMQYIQIIPVLVKAVQELSAKVTALESA